MLESKYFFGRIGGIEHGTARYEYVGSGFHQQFSCATVDATVNFNQGFGLRTVKQLAQFSGFSSRMFPSSPIYTVVEVTISSRIASIGGFVT